MLMHLIKADNQFFYIYFTHSISSQTSPDISLFTVPKWTHKKQFLGKHSEWRINLPFIRQSLNLKWIFELS